jgi:predicted metal-dependent hydrolase
MAEECEHKTVMFDVYERLSGGYWVRAVGVLHGSLNVLGSGWSGMVSAVQRDVPESRLRRVFGIARELGAVTRKVGPYLLRALHPSCNPRDETEPDWLEQWQSYTAQNENKGPMPVIDTTSEDMGRPVAAN